jgi:hypothetical protein
MSQMGNASHQKMESIGEISNETSSTMSTSHKSAKDQSCHYKEKQPAQLHKSSSVESTAATTTCSVSLLVSGERVDVSNLVPESERTPERLNRRRITQHLFRANETVYPKLPDQMQDDSIDLHVLLAQHQQRNQQNSPPPPPSRRAITELEPSHQPSSQQRSTTGYPTPPPPGTNDRRANWQHEQTFAQHSFTRRQQERSHQQHQHQHHEHQQPPVRGPRSYPYARVDSGRRHQEFPGGGENSPDNDTTLLLDMRSHRRRESYNGNNGEYSSSSSPPRGRIMTRRTSEQGSSYLEQRQNHNNNYSHDNHRGDQYGTTSANASEYEYAYYQHQHQAQYQQEETEDRPQHYPYGSGRAYPTSALLQPSGSSFYGSDSQLQFSGNGSGRVRRDQQRTREGRDRHYQSVDANGYSGSGGGGGGSYERGHNNNGGGGGGGGDGHASMYDMRSPRHTFDRGDYQHQPPTQQQQHRQEQQPQAPKKNRLEVEIAPGVMARLRGADETTLALEQGRVVGSDCLCCGARSLCIDDASYLLCPICKVVNPLRNTGDNKSGGVGLGILEAEADYY